MTDERDELLGRALRDLDVPEHRPGFWQQLDARLHHHGGDAGDEPDGGAPRGRRSPWPPPPRPLRRRPAAPPPRRPVLGVLTMVAAAALLVVATVAVLPRMQRQATEIAAGGPEPRPSTTSPGQPPVAAPAVGHVVGEVSVSGAVSERWRVLWAPDGSWRLESADGEVRAYDAATATRRSVNPGGVEPFVVVGVAPAVAPAEGPTPGVLDLAVAYHVAAQARAGDPDVEEVEALGRRAWRLVFSYPVAGGAARWVVDATVDRETLLPLRTVEDRDGTRLVTTFETLEVRPEPPPAGTFEVAFPPGQEPDVIDRGHRRTDPGAVATLAPTRVPPGFLLTDAFVHTGRGSTVLLYRRGFEQLAVTTAAETHDPYTALGDVGPAERATVEGGPLDGRAAAVVALPPTVPHVWAAGERLGASVGGALPGDQLLGVLGSLERR